MVCVFCYDSFCCGLPWSHVVFPWCLLPGHAFPASRTKEKRGDPPLITVRNMAGTTAPSSPPRSTRTYMNDPGSTPSSRPGLKTGHSCSPGRRWIIGQNAAIRFSSQLFIIVCFAISHSYQINHACRRSTRGASVGPSSEMRQVPQCSIDFPRYEAVHTTEIKYTSSWEISGACRPVFHANSW